MDNETREYLKADARGSTQARLDLIDAIVAMADRIEKLEDTMNIIAQVVDDLHRQGEAQ